MFDFFTEFPDMSRRDLRDFKLAVDGAFRDFSRTNGEAIEGFFDPLLWFLIWLEKLLVATPWPVILIVVGGLAYLGSRSWKLALGSVLSFALIGYFGMWEDTMSTIALISVATLLCVLIGMPLGIWMAKSDRVQAVITPILDVMQTIPIFVYLLPVLMLLGIGKVPGLIAVCVYAMPPMVRLTNLGIRLVDSDVLEASNTSLSTRRMPRLVRRTLEASRKRTQQLNQAPYLYLATLIQEVGRQKLGWFALRPKLA